MRLRSSTASRLLVCLVTTLLLASATVGGVTAATEIGDSDLPESEYGSLEATTDSLEWTVAGTTSGLETVVTETTEELENSTNETTDDLENGTTETTDALENTTTETTDELENGTDETTDDLENATTLDATTGITFGVVEGVGLEGTLTLEAALEAAIAGSERESDEQTTADGTNDGTDADTDGSGQPSGMSSATDAVLVGLLGAITASGAAASGSAGGASGAAGGTSSLVSSWLSRGPGLRHVRHAGSLLPWELVPIFRYSRYDDSDPLENETRRTVYETIEANSGRYLSQVSEESDVALSTVRHHVRILEEEGLVTTAKVNGKRRYYLDDETPAEFDDDSDGGPSIELQAAFEEPAKREVLETLAAVGGVPNSRLADELDCDPSTVSHHLAALEEDGLVCREKDGRSMVNELAAGVETALADESTLLEEESTEPTVSTPADD